MKTDCKEPKKKKKLPAKKAFSSKTNDTKDIESPIPDNPRTFKQLLTSIFDYFCGVVALIRAACGGGWLADWEMEQKAGGRMESVGVFVWEKEK